jgi:hypothetical protein
MAKTWGTPTWYLFHTMAEHVRPEFYDAQKSNIVSYIKTICSLLPCPICRDHAVAYTRSLNDRMVPTKEALKQYLFTFHNSVNERLKKPKFTNYDMYKTMKLREVFLNFETEFLKNNVLSRKFFEQQHRRNLLTAMRSYFMSNAAAFVWL